MASEGAVVFVDCVFMFVVQTGSWLGLVMHAVCVLAYCLCMKRMALRFYLDRKSVV